MTVADTFRLSDHDLYLFREGAGHLEETLNSNALHYGGDGSGNFGGVDAAPAPAHGKFQSLTLTLPPVSTLFFTSAEREASR